MLAILQFITFALGGFVLLALIRIIAETIARCRKLPSESRTMRRHRVAAWSLIGGLSAFSLFLLYHLTLTQITYSQVHYWTHFSVGPQLARAHIAGEADKSSSLASNFGAVPEHFEVIMDAPHDRVHVVYREKMASLFRPDVTEYAVFRISDLREQKR